MNSNLKKLQQQDKNRKKKRAFDFVLLLLCSASIFASLVVSYKLGRLDEKAVWQRKEAIDRSIEHVAPYIDKKN